jgi:ketosteroid isomerase-like protein
MDTQQRDGAVVQELVDRHFAVWNSTDSAQRLALFAGVYTADIFVADYDGMVAGFAAVDAKIAELQAMHPGFQLRPTPAAWNHGIGRVTWEFGPAGETAPVHGEDIFTIRDGKISSLHVFINQQPG